MTEVRVVTQEHKDNTFESYMRRLKRLTAEDREKKAGILHEAEQYGEITGEQYERLVDAAYPT